MREPKHVSQSPDLAPASTPTDETAARPRPRRSRFWSAVSLLILLAFAAVAGYLALGLLYRGPASLDDVTQVMPGVPLFPLSRLASNNRLLQHAMAIPLRLIRLQGARRAESALLEAPGDSEFIVEWYHKVAPSQGWELVGEGKNGAGWRMLFVREQEGLQVLVGPTPFIVTPVQLTYLSGMTNAQMAQYRGAAWAPIKVVETLPKLPPKPKPAPTLQPEITLTMPTTPPQAPLGEKTTSLLTLLQSPTTPPAVLTTPAPAALPLAPSAALPVIPPAPAVLPTSPAPPVAPVTAPSPAPHRKHYRSHPKASHPAVVATQKTRPTHRLPPRAPAVVREVPLYSKPMVASPEQKPFHKTEAPTLPGM